MMSKLCSKCFLYFRKLFDGMDVEETKLKLPSPIWIPLIICFVLLFFVDVFQISVFVHPSLRLINDVNFQSQSLAGFEIKTPGCKIPAMDPWDRNIKEFIYDQDPPKCNNGVPALFETNLTHIYYLNSSLPFYNISTITEVKCCYKVFRRIKPKEKQNDDRIEFSVECYNITGNAKIKDEFIEVKCFLENSTIYHDMFAFVPIKNFSKKIVPDPKPLSILLVGLDAVSRLNLQRQMPETLKYLKEIDAVDLLGYNKVGDNTFPNLIPALTGMSEEELRNTCWPNKTDRFDKCPFIWKNFKDNGYVTAFGEDASWMGLFNYQRHGFEEQPTDYGYNYFNEKAEATVGNSHNMNVKECLGSRQVYKDMLDYISKFSVTMEQNRLPYFAFFWGVSLSHDYLNKPKLGDSDYKFFFKSLHDEGRLENTVLVFLSDHGIRWGPIRQTYQGRMEERLPFLIIRLPKWFRRQHERAYYNLLKNVRRLTTPFDLHETLMDFTKPSSLIDQNVGRKLNDRGVSLFKEISDARNCDTAAIKSHWCTCQQSKKIETSSAVVKAAAQFSVGYINDELKGYAQCATLTIDNILNARMMMHDGDIEEGDNTIQDYMLTVRTLPGGAVFEVTVRYVPKNSHYDVIGTISRLNLYGTQSLCITDYHLKLYCYCKSLLS